MKYYPGCDIKEFVKSMTLQQKVDLQATLTAITSKAIPEVGIPSMCIADGVTGINFLQVYLDRLHTLMENAPKSGILQPGSEEERDHMSEEILRDVDKVYETGKEGTLKYEIAREIVKLKPNNTEPTCFPSGVVLGSTWNPEQVYKCGKYVGREMAAYGVDVVLGPNVDIQRDPLCGRGYECYGEDPYLVGQTAAAFIKGLQSEGVAGCAKHFAANNQETNRSGIDVRVSERALREIYLKGFEYAVKEAGVKSIMMAYNKINGEHCAESSHFMKDIIREEWGFEGCIVSDWGAAKNEPASINAGLDMVLPERNCDIKEAIAGGELDEAELDRGVVRIIQMYEKLNGMTGRSDPDKYDDTEAVRNVYDCIVDGAVLLKNDNTLPLSSDTKTVFWGKRSKGMIDCGGGSTQVFTKKTSSILKRAEIIAGINNCSFECMDDKTQALVYTAAYPGHEDADNVSLRLEYEDQVKITEVLKDAREKGIKTIVVLNTAGPVDMRDWIAYADAVLCVYLPGCEGGNAAADIIYGLASPGGRLTQTFPVKYEDVPSSLNFPGYNGIVNYGEGIFVGYRYYDKKGIEPAFPFGYGLTYTTFEINAEPAEYTVDTDIDFKLEIAVSVRNTGKRAGAEVVQLYVGQDNPYMLKPQRELKGYSKVWLEPGEQKKVTLMLDKGSFSHYDEKKGGWCIETGKYTLFIGKSSRDINIKIPVMVKGINPYGINEHTSIYKVAENKYLAECMCGAIPDFKERLPEILRTYGDMPLVEVYNNLMPEYYINSIEGSIMFREACRKMNTASDPSYILRQ